MFGYVEFYFKLVSKNHKNQIAYAKYQSDFSKNITEDFYNELSKEIEEDYNRYYVENFSISECTKEEYESFVDTKKPINIIEWEEGNIKIE